MSYADYKKESNYDLLESVLEIIEIEGLKEKSNKHCLTNKRQYLIWFLKENTGDSYNDIGSIFNMSHSSTLQAHRKHNTSMEFRNDRYVNNIKIIHRYLLEKFPKAINVNI